MHIKGLASVSRGFRRPAEVSRYSIDDRGALRLGTALGSTLFLSAALAPSPAGAQQAVNLPNQVVPVVGGNMANCVFIGG